MSREKEIGKAFVAFYTLAKVRYKNYLKSIAEQYRSLTFFTAFSWHRDVYAVFKLRKFIVVDDIENLMIDDPKRAHMLLNIYGTCIVNPLHDLRVDLKDLALQDIKRSRVLPKIYQPEMQLPCEIGKFLLRKLTYAAQDVRACYDLNDHYNAYDLCKVQKSLNEAIVTNHLDIVNKRTEELSEILDNVWNDPEIPKLVKNLRRGVPMSIAAIGTAVSAFTGGLEGFLAGLGFSVGAKFLDAEIEGLSERLAKWLTRSYQANVYDFKKKYKDRIVSK